MPGKPLFRPRSLVALFAATQATLVVFAARASAAPTPTPSPSGSNNPCDLIYGAARDYCEDGEAGSGARSTPTVTDDALDPLTSLARGCADAAAYLVGKLSEAVESTATVDFTNSTFRTQYAVVFAASTILTLVLWLFAVAKRAIRGVPFTTA
ncbi:hypothetical protein DLE01_30915, partial [Streptomyces sp. FT05W]